MICNVRGGVVKVLTACWPMVINALDRSNGE